jgi:hypothetical protein
MFCSKLAFSRKTIVLALIAGVVLSVLLISVSGHSTVWTSSTEDSKPPAPAQQGKKDQRLEVEVVNITPDGFEPQQIERPAGPFVLAVTNRSGVDSLTVQIETEQHSRFREKSLPLLTPYWREVINPPPGKYVITEPNHPEWTLTLVIQ